MYEIQVESADKYKSENYLTPQRWSSYAIQVREVMNLKPRPKRILEIGPGNNIVTNVLKAAGFDLKTLDFDSRVKPDYAMSITDEKALAKLAGKFDLIIACQIFEHLEYEDFRRAIRALKQVAPKIIISLPHTSFGNRFFYFSLKIPGLRRLTFARKLIYKSPINQFNGQHYWEMGKRGFPIRRIVRDLQSAGWKIQKRFFNPDNPYHYFFVATQI